MVGSKSWPSYPPWSDHSLDVTLVQGSDPSSKLVDTYPSDFTAPAVYAGMMTNPSYPLYLDSSTFNPLIDLHSAADGITSWAAAVGLREQDLFGTCLVIFLMLAASISVISILLWCTHGLLEFSFIEQSSTALSVQRNSLHSSPRTSSLGGKRAYDPQDKGFDTPTLPTRYSLAANRASTPSRLRRTWHRFRPKGEAGAFHAAALYGNLLRLVLMFHLPITTFSVCQLTLGSNASIVSRVFAALAFAFISIAIPAGVILKLYRTPGGKLYDATRTLQSLGPTYNVYVEGKQLFRVFPITAMLCTGIVVGAGQRSGLVQAVILVLVELVMLIIPAVWYPWGEGASMGAPSAFLGVIRVASMVMVMLLSPTVSFSCVSPAEDSSV